MFFELMQVAVGNRERLSCTPTLDQWKMLFEICKKQTLVGIGYVAMKRLPREQWPQERRFLMRWTMSAEKKKTHNEKISGECVEVCKKLRAEGFHTCILKGQANIRYYRAMGEYRTPGDIDVWMWSDSGRVADVIRYAKRQNPDVDPHYHHVECQVSGDTETELHYRPSWMSTPWQNRAFQQFCEMQKPLLQEYEGFPVPTPLFDSIFQLVHIYRHLFSEGIGMRQVLDYYMILQSLTDAERESARQMVKRLGLVTFTRSLMYVLRVVFLMPEDKQLFKPKKKDGRILLREIMLAGNFGHADARYTVTREDDAMRWGIMKLRRNMTFLRSYPQEVLAEPLFRIYHWCWRTFKLWR